MFARKGHAYLGMNLDFMEEFSVKISMIKYIKKIFVDFPEEIRGKAATPVADNLFKVREDSKKPLEEQAHAFQTTVAQLVFLCKCVRSDIQTPVSFLTKRVQEPDKDDWGKLKRVLQYLKGKIPWNCGSMHHT